MNLCDQCNKPLRNGSIEYSDKWHGVIHRHKKCQKDFAAKQAVKRAKETAEAWIRLLKPGKFPKGAGAVTRGVK